MTRPARIPADVNRPDRVLGPFTARQTVLLLVTAAVLYGAWIGLRPRVPLPLFLALAVPVAAVAVAVALGQRDGLPLDRFLLAALRHHANPRRVRATPAADLSRHGGPFDNDADERHRPARARGSWRPGPAGLFAHADTTSLGRDTLGPGVLDLGADGLVAIAAVSTLNLGLHTPAEQDALLAGYTRYLHTLTGPVQFLIRTVPVDLDSHLTALYEQARTLPHPALVAAAVGHRANLARLAAPGRGAADDDELTARQVLLVLREPAGGAGGQRLARRLEDAIRILASLDIAVTPLDAAQLSALLTDCFNPGPAAATRPHRDRSPGAAPMAPVAITRRHPQREHRQPELDDLQLEELSLAHDPTPPHTAPPRRRRDAADPWARMPHVPIHLGPVDFTLADDSDDDRDTHSPDTDDHDTDGGHPGDGGWFDDPGLPDHRAGYNGRGGDITGDLAGGPDGQFDLDEFDPGAAAARWWGR